MNPYWTAEGLLGVMYFVFCVCIVGYRVEAAKRFEAIDVAILTMGIVYGLTFPLVVHDSGSAQITGYRFIEESANFTYLHTIAAVMGAVGLIIGWQSVSARRRRQCGAVFFRANSRSVLLFLYAMVAAALVTQYLYVVDYGGFVGYFDYNTLIRSGQFDSFERSRFSFLRPFGNFAILACLGFWGLLLSGRHRGLSLIGFVMSLAMAAYVLYASLGRVGMVSFAAIFPVSILLRRRFHYLAWLATFFAIAMIGISSLYLISNLFGIKGAHSLSDFIAREASFPFVSFFANLSHGHHFYLFRDVIVSPAYLAPSSMTDSWLGSAPIINTTIIEGAPKGVGGVTGEIPTDILTFGLMQLSFVGVLIYSMLIGYAIRIVSVIAKSFSLEGLSCTAAAYVMIKIGAFAVFYAYPKHIIMSNFGVIAILLAVSVTRLVRGTFGSVRIGGSASST